MCLVWLYSGRLVGETGRCSDLEIYSACSANVLVAFLHYSFVLMVHELLLSNICLLEWFFCLLILIDSSVFSFLINYLMMQEF